MIEHANSSALGLRSRPRLTREIRRELRESLTRLLRPEVALELARRHMPADFRPVSADCTLRSSRVDRFVVRVVLRSASGEERAYAIKVHGGDFAERRWALAQRLGRDEPWTHDVLVLPLCYLDRERALVFPWIQGDRLSDIVDERKPDLLRQAAEIVARIHLSREREVPPLTLDRIVGDALVRCAHVLASWPALDSRVLEIVRLLERATEVLDTARPTLLHGDLGAAQFLWTGSRLVLLDLDTMSCGDPAYDVGHFLGQLERRCTLDDTLPDHARDWVDGFLRAYPMASHGVSARNVSFYRGVTLFRKMYTLCSRDPVTGPRRAVRLAERARAALEAALPRTERRIA